MKKLLSFFLVLVASVGTMFAVTETEAREYFQRCILNLDPIEGCYSVEYRGHGEKVFGPAWSKFAETSLRPDCYIVKMNEERNGKFLVCLGNTADQDWQYYYVLERIGTTNAYKFLLYNKENKIVQSCHTYMENELRFIVNFHNMGAGGYTSAMDGTTYVGGSGHEFQLSFIKSFPTAEMYEAAQNEDIRKNQSYSSGTAFALKNGYFITNYHVYGERKYALAKGLNNDIYHAYYVAGDEANDLAIFQIRDSKFKGFGNITYNIAKQTAEIGEEVWTIGFPLTSVLGDEAKYTKGEISALSGTSGDGSNIKTNDTRFYQITTPITYGNSGGPLFDEAGNLIGITSSGWNNLNNVNYAIKSHFLFTLLESAGLNNVAPNRNLLEGKKQKEQIKLVKPFIFQVITYNNKEVETELMQEAESVQEPEPIVASQSQTEPKTIKPSEPCDTILTLDGRKIYAKIVDIGRTTVMYKDLMANNENVQAIEKSTVQAIVFANGVRQDYNSITKQATQTTYEVNKSNIMKDESIEPIYKNGKTYYYKGQTYSGIEFEKFLDERCPEAYNQYIFGIKTAKKGYIATGIGAGMLLTGGIVYGCCKESVGGFVSGLFLMALGSGTLGGGVVILCIGLNKKNTAYKTFNANCHNRYTPDKYINLQVCQNGIGLSLTF